MLLIEPVLMRPLEQRWATVRQQILEALEVERAEETARNSRQARIRTDLKSQQILGAWIDELTSVRVLDPACGSGNFLYVALRRLLDLWLEATRSQPSSIYPSLFLAWFHPRNCLVSRPNFMPTSSPQSWCGSDFCNGNMNTACRKTANRSSRNWDNIEHGDAILRYDAEGKPCEPEWPKADFIIGNPPFLGDKRMRSELGDKYVDDLRALYEGRVPGGADLVTYWFENARRAVEAKRAKRVGLLATNSIRMVGNRPVLERIKSSGDIFMAWSDRPWLLDGAAVRVSMIGFDDGADQERTLDGIDVKQIHADLTAESNVASALPLKENAGLCFLGVMKGGPFDIGEEEARKMLSRPLNPNGRPNSDVVKRRLGGQDITGRDSGGMDHRLP